jgi:hypothetical protein
MCNYAYGSHQCQAVMEVPMENVTPYADNFIPVIPTEYSYHTDENPFCWDSDCPCVRRFGAR